MRNKGGRPKKTKKELLSEMIAGKLTKNEKALVIKKTDELDVSVSTWLRKIILEKLKEV